MEPSTSPPSSDLRIRISTALDNYRDKAFTIDYAKLCKVIAKTNAVVENDESEEEDLDVEKEDKDGTERSVILENTFFNHPLYHRYGPFIPMPESLKDVILQEKISIDQLLDQDTARRFLPIVAPPRCPPLTEEESLHDLQQTMQAQSYCDVPLPNEYKALTSLVSGIYPPGLPIELNHGIVYKHNHSTTNQTSLLEICRRFSVEELGYKAYGGFMLEHLELDPVPRFLLDSGDIAHERRAPPMFAWILCDSIYNAKHIAGQTDKRLWRIFFVVPQDQSSDIPSPQVFGSINELLEFFLEIGRVDRSWVGI